MTTFTVNIFIFIEKKLDLCCKIDSTEFEMAAMYWCIGFKFIIGWIL